MLKSAGCQMKPTVFLLTDTQIKEESFLEDVDSLLNTGEVPNLFAVDEKAELNEVMQLSSHKKDIWWLWVGHLPVYCGKVYLVDTWSFGYWSRDKNCLRVTDLSTNFNIVKVIFRVKVTHPDKKITSWSVSV